MKYGNKPLSKRILSSPITLVVVFILFILLARGAISVNTKSAASEKTLNEARADLAALQARQKDLSGKVASLSTDEGLDAELRSKYRAVKPGESLAVIVDDSKPATTVAATSTASLDKPGFFRRIWMFLRM